MASLQGTIGNRNNGIVAGTKIEERGRDERERERERKRERPTPSPPCIPPRMSMGIGNMMVDPRSAAMILSVWR